MDPLLREALGQFGEWVRSAGPEFWPKEEALHGWLLAALVESGFAPDPRMVIQEVHFGEHRSATEARELVGGGHWRLDLAVLPAAAVGQVRNVEALDPPPRMIVEVKSLNSAGTLTPAQIRKDLRKLQGVLEYFGAPSRGTAEAPTCLLLLVATAQKDLPPTDATRRSIQEKAGRWAEKLVQQANGVLVYAVLPDGHVSG